MAGLEPDFRNRIGLEFASADPDPIRDIERQSIARIRFTACYSLPDLDKHLNSTAQLALEMAEALGLSSREKENVWFAGSVHDVGKIGINQAILRKTGSLTDPEIAEVRNHTLLGHNIFSGVDGDIYRACADVALSHHERWDGGGYPHGIGGDRISLASRIVSIADVYDCITAGRPYQHAQTSREAITELRDCAGTQFDPELVKLFASKVRKG